jgi:hypothetical protein
LTGQVYQGPTDDYGNIANFGGSKDFDENRWSVGSNIFKAIGYSSIEIYKFEKGQFIKTGNMPFPNQ